MRYLSGCLLLVTSSIYQCFASASQSLSELPAQRPLITLAPSLPSSLSNGTGRERRQEGGEELTCGYRDGDPDQPRTANPGFDCRVDTQHALWGFCPTTVIAATDCGLAGSCVDSHGCSSGCGLIASTALTTFTCTQSGADFCSTAILTEGPDQTYSYLACASAAITDHLLAEATSQSSSQSSSTTSTMTLRTSAQPSSPEATTSSTSSSISSSNPPTASSTYSLLSPTSASSSKPSHRGANIGAIVGGTIGGIALVSLISLGALFLRRYRREHDSTSKGIPNYGALALREDANEDKYPYVQSRGFGPVELPTRLSRPVELAG